MIFCIDRIDLKVEDINPLSEHCIIATNISLNNSTAYTPNTPIIEYTCKSYTHIPYLLKHTFRKEQETNIQSIAIKLQLDNIYDTLHEGEITPYTIKTSIIHHKVVYVN